MNRAWTKPSHRIAAAARPGQPKSCTIHPAASTSAGAVFLLMLFCSSAIFSSEQASTVLAVRLNKIGFRSAATNPNKLDRCRKFREQVAPVVSRRVRVGQEMRAQNRAFHLNPCAIFGEEKETAKILTTGVPIPGTSSAGATKSSEYSSASSANSSRSSTIEEASTYHHLQHLHTNITNSTAPPTTGGAAASHLPVVASPPPFQLSPRNYHPFNM
ncbi:unnamed protein product [Amoebophrya sp. A120]|nr:unnamed protein product [Amoebophrya sp. A120]|eukprot:GSA120T00021032001.1